LLAAPAGFSLCCVGGGARLSVNSSEAEATGAGAGLAAGRRICQTGLDRPTGTPPPERPGLAAHRRSGGAPPASPRELLREHGALLTFLAGCRGLDEPDPDPPPAERLREKGQMLMFSSEPAPPEPQCPPPCFRLLPVPSLRFSFSLSRSFSSATGAGFLEKMSVQRLEPPPPPPEAVGGAGEVIEAVGGGATVARRDASPSSGSGSGSATGGTPWLMALPLFFLDACFGGRTGSGRITPPAKSSSAQEGEAAGLGWSGQNSNSGEEDALLLLLASAASMAAWELEEPAAVCFLLRPIASEVVEVEGEGGERKVGRWQRAALYGWVREADEGH